MCHFSAAAVDAKNPEPKRILTIYSYHEGLPWEKHIDDSLQATLASKSTEPIELSVEHADRIRFPDEVYLQNFIERLRYKYSKLKLDLVIGIDDEATDILLKYGEELFPGVPVVFVTAERKILQKEYLKHNMTSLMWGPDIQGTVDLILIMLPKTRQIFIITGSSKSDRETQRLTRNSLRGYTNRVEIKYLEELSLKDLMNTVEHLPEHSVLLYEVFSRDSEGQNFVPREILSDISLKANAPTFGVLDTYLGFGIVGGSLLSADAEGRRCAEIGLRIISGAPPVDNLPARTLNIPMFDARQLKRWGINEAKLPPGSIVRYREFSFWRQYRLQVIGLIVFVLIQTSVIILLWVQIIRRRHAQIKLAEELHFEEMLSALSARFVNLPPDQVDEEIKCELELIGKELNIDRVSIFEISDEDQMLRLVHSYTDAEIAAPPAEFKIEQLPWVTQKLLIGEILNIADLQELPAEAETDRSFLQTYGTVSLAAIPLLIKKKAIGVLSLGMLRNRKKWPPKFIQQSRLIAEIFANALARKQHEESLIRAETKYRTVADFTYDWEYWANLEDSLEYVSPSCESISGYTIADFMDNPSLLREIIVPEDREIWDSHFHDSRHALKSFGIQFRIQRRDGEICWIEHNCQPVTDLQGRLLGFRASNRDITSRKLAELDLQKAYNEVEKLKKQLEDETAYLQTEIKLEHNYESIIGNSAALKYVLYKMEQVAGSDTTVLILGESGTGKELIARAIHSGSLRSGRPLVKVDCATLSPNLIDNELFGHERGAFTGAENRQPGRFEIADGTTIFLDEIGELPLDLQTKLLRVLQEGEFERLGSTRTIKVDVRVIAATNRDLDEEVRRGRFREDLFYRLNVFPITVPSLRQRAEDIPLLAHFFVERSSKRLGKSINQIPKSTIQKLQSYAWPGNIREMENVIERAVIISSGSKLNLADDLTEPDRKTMQPLLKSLQEIERDHIQNVLKFTNWRIEGPKGASQILDMNPSTLRSRMRKLGIDKP